MRSMRVFPPTGHCLTTVEARRPHGVRARRPPRSDPRDLADRTSLQAVLSKADDKVDAAVVETFLSLQRDLNTMLAIAGGIIGLATLATGALRNAVLAVHLRFDAYYLLLYGLYFTGVLAVAFAPSYLAMRNTGARLRDRSFSLPDPNDSSCFDVLTKRKSFDDLIQLNLWASATFKAGVAILAPLASA